MQPAPLVAGAGEHLVEGLPKAEGAVADLDRGDFRASSPRFEGENFDRNLGIVAAIEVMAGRKGCTPAQLALAWVLHQGRDIVPIPGTRRRRYLEDNVGALAVKLSEEDLAELDRAVPRGAAAGERYAAAGMNTLNL